MRQLRMVMTVGLAALLLSCGGGRKRSIPPPVPSGGVTPAGEMQGPSESALDETLAELDALETPEGVDEGLFLSLKTALADALRASGKDRFVSAPPIGPNNKVDDLDLIDNFDGTYSLVWSYKNMGDYNQDGIVNIQDITPLAVHFNETADATNEWIDGNGDTAINIADITPLAAGFFNEVAGYTVEGAQSLLEPWSYVDEVSLGDAQGEGRLRFSVLLEFLDYQTYHVVPFDSASIPGEPSRDTLSSHSLEVSGTVEWDTGGAIEGATVLARTRDGSSAGEVDSGVGGTFTIELAPVAFPTKVVVEVNATEAGSGLNVTNFQWTEVIEDSGAVDSVLVVLPDPAGSELTVAGGQASAPDGSIYVDGLPGEVNRVFGRAYDPDASPDAFPGEFADDIGAELNSSVFLWITGTDAGGAQIDQLSSPATVRLEVPSTQWGDLTDIFPGNAQIDIPIYDFDYETGQWVAANDGWLVTEADTIIPEEMEPDITSGAYAGRIYAKFTASHFSFHNVDYPYIYVWTLSRIPADKRNNEFFYKAMKLAEKIAKSQKGKDAYAKVNKPGETIDSEYFTDGQPDNAGKKAPEVKTKAMNWNKSVTEGGKTYTTTTNGEYWGRVRGHRQDEFYINQSMWDIASSTSTARKKKEAIVLMASTILHEFAHQKQHTKKGEAETTEVGKRLEKDLFGGDIHYWPDSGLELDGNPVSDATLDGWLNDASWPAPAGGSSLRDLSAVGDSGLELILSTSKSTYDAFEPIYLDVTFRNGGTQALEVLPWVFGVHYPIRLEITDEFSELVDWNGPYLDMNFTPDSFVTLNPGEQAVASWNLRYDELNNMFRYDLFTPGTYDIKAIYSEYLPPYDPVESNTISITVEVGEPGSINGTVTDDPGGAPLQGIKVYLSSHDALYAETVTDAVGYYEFPTVPQGNFVLGFAGAGYAPKMATATVTAGAAIAVNAQLAASADVPTTAPVFGDFFDVTVDEFSGDATVYNSLINFSGARIGRALNGAMETTPFTYDGSNYGTFTDTVILTTGANGIRYYAANELGFTISEQLVEHWTPVGTVLYRATLTWDVGEGSDMDLHTVDPNGEESYYGNQQITTGKLDHDDTDGWGPENFTCVVLDGADPVPGTYHVFVVNYDGTPNVNNTITLRMNLGTPEESVVVIGPYELNTSGETWYAVDVQVDATGFVTYTTPGTPPPAP